MADDATSERIKYEEVYTYPGYGRKGHATPYAFALIERAKPGSTIGDFGCGRGGSFRAFLEAGFKIIPVDHVDALLPEFCTPAVAPLVKQNLWEGKLPQVDYGVCSDVMEHIPEQFVNQTIANIAGATKYGCLWSICHVKDVWGLRMNKVLHMTVKPKEWWKTRLEEHWYTVTVIRAMPGMTAFWTEHLL